MPTWEQPKILPYRQIHQSEELIKEAKDVLPTTTSFHNFEDKLEQAYTEDESTENLEYTIDTLVSIDETKNSPIQQQELNNITNDSQFSSFVHAIQVDLFP